MKFLQPGRRLLFGMGFAAMAAWLAAAHLGAQSAPQSSKVTTPTMRRLPPTSAPTGKPVASKPTREDSSKSAAREAGKKLNLTGSGMLRAAPLNEGGQGGYSSGMEAPPATPANSALEEQVMKNMLLNPVHWRVGPNGLIERSRGNGEWVREAGGVKSNLRAVAFASPLVGWIVGDGGTVLRTQDGGRSWRQTPFPNADDLVQVRVTGPESLEVVAKDGKIFSSSDAGKVWRPMPEPSRPRAGAQP